VRQLEAGFWSTLERDGAIAYSQKASVAAERHSVQLQAVDSKARGRARVSSHLKETNCDEFAKRRA
jgi:hypothetical protein